MPFENDVKKYGTQTKFAELLVKNKFENDVKMYGTQTKRVYYKQTVGLRMM